MGFLSSLFGGGGSSRPATTTNVVSQKLPPEIAPYVTKVLEQAQERFDSETEAGYQPYTGETSAGLTAEQEQALTGLAGMVGTQQPFIDESGEIIRQGGEQFTGDIAQQYMSPYQQAVTDIELREAQNKFDTQIMPQFEAAAVGAGGMSGLGSRAGVQAAELQRGQSQLLADIQAKGLQKSYDAGIKEYGQQKARENQMAGQIAALGGKEVAANLTEFGALKSAGEERQALNQGALDEAYFKYQQEQQFPKQNLAEFSQLIYGNPLVNLPTTSEVGTKSAYQPSTGQNLLGMGLGAANIYGMGGGFGGDFSGATLGNTLFGIKKKEGGNIGEGLSGLPVVRRDEGGQSSPGPNYTPDYGFEEYQTDTPSERLRKRLANPNLAPEQRAKLIREGALGSLLATDPNAADVALQNRNREIGLSNINKSIREQRKAANQKQEGDTKRIINQAETQRRDNLDNEVDVQRANLIQNMKNKGASRKEIQDALNAMPKRGPGLSTKTGSPSGFGQDVVNILETLRTDVNKQKALDDTRKRTDIYNMGKMKRADQAVEAAGESAIASTEAKGKSTNTSKTETGNLAISKLEADNIKDQLSSEQQDQLKEFALKQTGIAKIEALPARFLKEVQEAYKITLLEADSEAKKIAAGSKAKSLDKSAAPYLTRLNETIATKLKYKIKDGKPMIGDKFLKGKDAEEWAATVAQAQNVFLAAAKGKATSNKSYNKSLSIANRFIKGELGDITELKSGDNITPDKIYITNRGLFIGNKKGTQLVPYEG